MDLYVSHPCCQEFGLYMRFSIWVAYFVQNFINCFFKLFGNYACFVVLTDCNIAFLQAPERKLTCSSKRDSVWVS